MALTTLANTKWVINSSPNNVSVNDTTFALAFSSNGNSYNQFEFFENARENIDIYYGSTGAYVDNVWQNQAYKTIEITGGTDVTNANLIAWLEANATQQPTTSYKTFDLSTLGLADGTHTIQVKARATGYKDSNFSNSVSYTVSSSHTVTLVIVNETQLNYKESYKVYDGIDNTGTLLVSSSGANVSTPTPQTLVCQSGHLYFEITGPFVWVTGSATSGITPNDFDFSSGSIEQIFDITSDGTITFTYLKWLD